MDHSIPPYKVEPSIDNNEISINLDSYDGDFNLSDISELIEGFKKSSCKIKLNTKGRPGHNARNRCGTSAPLENQLPNEKGNSNGSGENLDE